MEKEIAANIQKGIDEPWVLCYNNQRWFKHGEMAERLMALVLKTSDTERYRGFESLSLRQLLFEAKGIQAVHMEKYPSGRRGSPAKGVVCESAARVQIPPSPPEKPPQCCGGFSVMQI